MNKEQLIEKMRYVLVCEQVYENGRPTIPDLTKAAEICAEVALSELTPKWVKVEDEPLSKSGWVCVVHKQYGVMRGHYAEYDTKGIWEQDYMTSRPLCLVSDITHYQYDPLPEPPKKDIPLNDERSVATDGQ